jgi:biopolymer transport protein ExbB
MNLLGYVKMGGGINWILVVGFLISAVLVIERLIYFAVSSREDSPSSQIGQMRRISRGTEAVPEKIRTDILEKHGALLMEKMEKGIWFLKFIATASPTLGLLGTVLGLIRAFRDMSAMGTGGTVQDFSSGIWVAMLTTACGLIVALPAMFFVSYFKRLIKKRSLDMSLAVDREYLQEMNLDEVKCSAQIS